MAGQMDADLAGTLDNLNAMIDTANTTISRLAPAVDTSLRANQLSDAISCISKNKWSCDKDRFDTAFYIYTESLTCTEMAKTQYKNSSTDKCDPKKVFQNIYETQGATLLDSVTIKITTSVNQLNDLLKVANEQLRYYNHMEDLADKYDESKTELQQRADKTVSRLKTEHRRTFYEHQQTSLVEYVTKFLTFFYWVTVFAWVIVIIYRTKYTSHRNIGLTIAFITFPFIADILIVWTFQVVMTVYSKLPTDAYLDMNRGS